MTGIWRHKSQLFGPAVRFAAGPFLWKDHYIYGMNTYRFGIGFYKEAGVSSNQRYLAG
jgi:hypothetical protein